MQTLGVSWNFLCQSLDLTFRNIRNKIALTEVSIRDLFRSEKKRLKNLLKIVLIKISLVQSFTDIQRSSQMHFYGSTDSQDSGLGMEVLDINTIHSVTARFVWNGTLSSVRVISIIDVSGNCLKFSSATHGTWGLPDDQIPAETCSKLVVNVSWAPSLHNNPWGEVRVGISWFGEGSQSKHPDSDRPFVSRSQEVWQNQMEMLENRLESIFIAANKWRPRKV